MQARRIVRTSIVFAGVLVGLAGFAGEGRAATTYYTNVSQNPGNWTTAANGTPGTIWNTSSTGTGGTSYSMSSSDPNNFVVVSGGLVRSTSTTTFAGNSLTINSGAQIRFKGTTATGGYTGFGSTVYTTGSATVNFNAGPNGTAAGTGLFLNGGTLDPGDAGTVDILKGLLTIQSNSFLDCGNAATGAGRVLDLEMSISGSNTITVVNAGASTNTYSGTGASFLQVGNNSGSASSTFSGTWSVNQYGLNTNGLNVLGMSGSVGVSTVNLGSTATFCMTGTNATSTTPNSNNSQAIAALNSLTSGAGTVNLGANTLTIDGGATSSYSGIIVGTGAMIFSGTGTSFLGRANTFTGGTTLSAGSLQLNAVGALGSGSLSVSGGTLDLDNNSQTYTAINLAAGSILSTVGAPTLTGTSYGVQSGSIGVSLLGAAAALTKSGTGLVNLSGAASAYGGGTTITGGTLQLGHANALGSGGVNISGGGMLDLAGFAQASGAVSLASGSIVSSTGAATLTGTSYSVQSGAISANLGGAAAALTMSGPGLLTLAGSNGYGGGTTVNGGVLQVGNPAALGVSSAPLTVSSSATLNVNGFSVNTGALSGGGTVDNLSGNGTFNAGNGNGSSTFAGTIQNTVGSLNLNKSGTGVLTLLGANTYSGTTGVNTGGLFVNGTHTGGGGYNVASGGTLGGAGSISAAVALNSGASLVAGNALGSLTAGTLSLGGLTTSGGGTVNYVLSISPVSGNSLVNVNGPLTLNGTTTVAVNDISGALVTGNYPLFAYSGGLTSSPTSLVLANSGSVVSPRQTYFFDYGTTTPGVVSLDVNGNPVNLTWVGGSGNVWSQNVVGNQVWWDGIGGYSADNFFASGDNVTFSGSASAGNLSVTLSGALSPSAVTVTGANNYVFHGSGFIQGPTSLTLVGPGTLSLGNTSGGNRYTGGTFIQGGTIVLGNNNVLPTAGTVTFGSNSTSGTLDLTAFNQTVAGLAVAGGATASNQVITSSFGNAILSFSGGATPSIFGGSIQDNPSGFPVGTLNLTVGAGTLDASSGGTTYYGATTVNGGALVVNTLPNTSGINVAAGGSLTITAANQNVAAAVSNAGNASFTASSGTTTLSGGLSGTGTTTFAAAASIPSVNGGTVNFNGATALITSLGNATVNLANSGVLSVSGGSQTAGTIAGPGSLVVGPGMLTLNSTNSYAGGTTVSGGGTLSIAADANLGAAPAAVQPANITLNAGMLQFTANTAFAVPTISASRGITLGASGGTINVPTVASGTFGTNEVSVQYRGTISGTGNVLITGGAGTNSGNSPYLLELGGSANSYLGTTTVSNAILLPESGSNGGTGPNNILPTTTVLNLINNGWFNLSNGTASETWAGLTGDTTGIVATTNGTSKSIVNIDPAAGQSYNFPGVIGAQTILGKQGSNNPLSLVINGQGTQILSGSNTYGGGTTISQGTLQLGNGGNTGSLAVAATSSITDNGTLAFNRGNLATQGVDFTSAGITGSGNLLQMGPGLLVLNATNTYSGGNIVTGGTLQLGSAAALGSGALAANGGVLDLAGYSIMVPSFSGAAGTISNSNLSGSGQSTLTVNQAVTTTFSGAINDGAATVALAVTGTGNLVLAGVNGYSGPTTVNNGLIGNHVALTVSGILSNSPVSVQSGTLLVSGTIGNNVTMSGGAIAGTPTISGSLAVTGNSTWYGAGKVGQGVTVQAGTFFLNGGTLGSPASPAVTVANSAALTGIGNGSTTGRIGGTVAVNGGGAIDFTKNGLAPGVTTTLGFGGLTLGDNSSPASLTFNVNTNNAQAADLISLGSGPLTVNASGAIINIAPVALVTGTYPLITYGTRSGAGAITLNPADAQIGLSTLALVSVPGALELSVTGNRTPLLAYWSGKYAASGGGNANWGGFNISGPVTNWSLNAAGTVDAGQIVGSVSDVVFAASSAPGPVNSVLDANFTINSLTETTAAAVSISGNQNLTINAAASGTGSLGYAAGNGIVIQPAAGALTINASTLIPAASQSWTNNSGSLLTVTSNVTGTAAPGNTTVLTLAGTGSGGSTISGAIGDGANGGNLALVVNTPNAVAALTGSNTYSGGTTLSAGTVTASSNGPLGTGPVTMNPSSGTALLAFTGAAPVIGSLANSGAGTSSVILGNATAPSATILTIAANNASNTFSGVISDLSLSNSAAIGSLVIAGSGALTLPSNNTYTGGTTISVGTLSTATNSPLGTGPVTMNPATGVSTLLFSGAAPVIGPLSSSGTGASVIVLGNATAASPTTLTVLGNNGSNTTYSGVIGDLSVANSAATGGLVVTGNGVLTLAGSSTYTGGTTVNGGGTLNITFDRNLGAVPTAVQPANITLNGGVLQITATSTFGTSTISATRGITLGALGGTINVPNVTSGTFATNEPAVQFNGHIVGSGNLTITGGANTNSGAAPYIFELGATNSYTGTTTVNNAVLAFENGNNGGTGPVNILPTTTVLNLVNNGWFNMNNGAAQQTIAGLQGDATGVVSITNGTSITGVTIDPGAGQSYTFAGTIGAQTILGKTGGNTTTTVTINGPGMEIFTGANTYGLATVISQGTLQLGNGGSTGSLASLPTDTITDNATLAFSRSNTVLQGTDFTSGAISGTGSVVQLGPGILILSGTNTYGGGTTVSGGTLQVGSPTAIPFGPGVGDMTVRSAGVLDVAGNLTNVNGLRGRGTVDSSFGGGTLAVGNNAAVSTFSGTIQNSNSAAGLLTLSVVGGGTLTLTGTNTYLGGTSVSNGSLIVTNNEAIADGTNLTVGDPSFFPAPVVPSPSASAGAAVAAVPEPGTLALVAAGAVAAIEWRRRKMRRA